MIRLSLAGMHLNLSMVEVEVVFDQPGQIREKGWQTCHIHHQVKNCVYQGEHGHISTRKLPQSISFLLIQHSLHSLYRFTSPCLQPALPINQLIRITSTNT